MMSTIFLNTFGKKVDNKNIIKIFTNNEILFEKLIDELINTKTISIRKEHDHSYGIFLDNNTKMLINAKDNNDKHYNYINCINIMEKLNINYLCKDDNNVDFTMNSMFGLGQSISFISNMDVYQKNHSINVMRNIEDNWYYIETN